MFFFVLTIPAVDGFVAISGWYGIRFTWKKFFKLWGLIAFYSILVYLLHWGAYAMGWVAKPGIFYVTGGWFGGSYLALMLFAPLISAGIDALAQDKQKLLSIWGLYALAVILKWLPTHGMTAVNASGWGSHTFNTLLFVYVTMRVVRLCDFAWFNKRRLGMILLGCITFLLLSLPVRISLYRILGKEVETCLDIMRFQGYDMPLIWIMAISAFLFFRHLSLPQWLVRVAAFCAPSMFGIYLFHDVSVLKVFLYQRPEAWLHATFPQLPIAVIILMCTCLCFTVSLGVDLLRRGVIVLLSAAKRHKAQ